MKRWLESALTRLIDRVPGFDRAKWRVIKAVIMMLWRVIDETGKSGKRGIMNIYAAAVALNRGASKFMNEVRATFSHLYDRHIPRGLRFAVDTAKVNSSVLDARLERRVNQRISDVRDDLRRRITVLNVLLRVARELLTALIGTVKAAVDRLIGNLQHVLRGPNVLANWLAAAMIAALWRYILGQDVRIGRWLRDRSFGFTLSAANRIESLIARLL